MASNSPSESASPPGDRSEPDSLAATIRTIFSPLASLKPTIVLLAMAIFIVLAGTLAQVNKDIWQVVDEYFRTAVAWIDLQIFFPRSWFPNMQDVPGGFYFPGGWLIGFVMAINLLVAHSLRFKIYTRGPRLTGGIVAIVVGVFMTWLVVTSGSNQNDMGRVDEVQWSTLWLVIKAGLGASWLAMIYTLVVLDRARVWERWILIIAIAALGSFLVWLLFGGQEAVLGESSMRILWQLIKGGLASLVLLGGCALVFKRRAGIVLLHAGVGLMMFSELLVGTQAIEGHMRIREGQTVNYSERSRVLELAIVDPSDPVNDEVVVVPAAMLRPGKPIRHNDLPFDITVLKYFANSALRDVRPGEHNLATAGTGLQKIATQQPSESGLDDKVNLAVAYVEFQKKDGSESLGSYLVGLLPSLYGTTERVRLDGKTYEVSLRYRRDYKPYSIRLIDFRFDKYLGTSKPKNYSSDVHLVDESRGIDRKVRIWMNNPLRYAGETFYQSGFDIKKTGSESTILQVVSNAGWMIPYVACMLVATGMLAHFWFLLARFLKKRSEQQIAPQKQNKNNPSQRSGRRSRTFAAVFPLLVVAAGAALFVKVAVPPKSLVDEMNLYEFGKLPLAYEGRVKPFDTLARNSLSILSDKQSFKNTSDERQSAIRWLLDVITGSQDVYKYKVFRIESLDVLQTLGLERRKGFRYAINEFLGHMDDFDKQTEQARERIRNKDPLSPYQKKIIELDNKIRLFRLLEVSFHPPDVRKGHEKEDLLAAMDRVQELARYQPPLAVPSNRFSDKPWESYTSAWTFTYAKKLIGEPPDAATISLSTILGAYAAGSADQFNAAVVKYQGILQSNPPPHYNLTKTNFEAFFNHGQPFFWAAILYVLAFVLASLAWLGWTAPLNRAAFWLIVLTLVVHTAALIARIYISGRPPVTNLYSSAVFIGWGCVVLGLILERAYRIGVGNAVAAVAGFASLLIAFFLSRSGDTFVVLQAVLDTQFWLATHVTCITLGYATTFIAGGLGILYILRGVFTPSLSPRVSQELGRMIYGTVCFSIFFSFVGTVLGGLWADDSWGRFWGWDPKENGALMIVLWNALVLHARWAGLVKSRGLALLAVGGNLCTAWSWFGVNELGVGLHSYGFTEGVLLTLGIFGLSQLAVIALGLLPRAWWWSFRLPQH